MAWKHDRRTPADIREESRKAKASAEVRRCPNCRRGGALKLTRHDKTIMSAMHGYVITDRKCRWCGFSDEVRDAGA